MKTYKAIPVRLQKANLTESEKKELAKYGSQPMSKDEVAAYNLQQKLAKQEEALARKTQYQRDRAAEYPPGGDQLDAILKGFNQLRLEGTNLPGDLDSVVNTWLAVKKKHPKPEETA